MKGISLSDFQLAVWIREIESDLKKGDVNVEGVIKALREMPREKTYANLDYYSFYELAKVKSNPIKADVEKTKKYIEEMKEKKPDPMPENLLDLVRTHGGLEE